MQVNVNEIRSHSSFSSNQLAVSVIVMVHGCLESEGKRIVAQIVCWCAQLHGSRDYRLISLHFWLK